MKRRGIGRGYVDKKKEADRNMANLGEEVSKQRIDAAKERLDTFKQKLQEFAVSHGQRIRDDPQFRYQFNTMCAKAGVDPLGSSKGFWASTLGIGDFYYELGVQVTQVCLVTRTVNGGVIELSELTERVRKKRPAAQRDSISSDDILQAVSKLTCLSPSFKVLQLGESKTRFVQSVPVELSTDGLTVITYLTERGSTDTHPVGCTSLADMQQHFGWTQQRVTRASEDLLAQSLLWEDAHNTTLWAPTVYGLDS